MIRRIPFVLAAALFASAAPLAAQTPASQSAQASTSVQASQLIQASQAAQDPQPPSTAESTRRIRGSVSPSFSGAAAQAGSASAPDLPKLEVTVIPAGALFFQSAGDDAEPSFNSYTYGAAVTYWVNKFVGVEGEVLGSVGRRQSLDTPSGGSIDAKTPGTLMYSGSAIYAINGHSSPLVPYVAGGIGGLSLFEQREVGVDERTTFLTVNVGGGVKWYHGAWGVRGDYRFIAVPSKDEAPGFFGQETRYGHRVYGGLFLALPSFR